MKWNEKFTVGIAKVSSYEMRFFADFLSESRPVPMSDLYYVKIVWITEVEDLGA